MISVIRSDSQSALDYELHKIKKNLAGDKLVVLEYDDNGSVLLGTLGENNLFGEQTTYAIMNASFLLKDEKLTSNIANFDGNLYIFVCAKKIQKLNKVADKLNVVVVKKFSPADKHSFVKQLLITHKAKFEASDAEELFQDSFNEESDQFIIENEFNKLLLLSNGQPITIKMVQEATTSSVDSSIFKLADYLIAGKKAQLISLYEELIKLKHQPIELMQIMVSKLYTLKIQKQAVTQGMSPSQIETELGINRYAQMMNNNILRSITPKYLNDLLDQMATLDMNIKNSLINPYLGLKLLLLK
jgi:DNA polymerase III delta subunit